MLLIMLVALILWTAWALWIVGKEADKLFKEFHNMM